MKMREVKAEVQHLKRAYEEIQREVDALILLLAPMASAELRRRLEVDDPSDSGAPALPGRRPHYTDQIRQQVKSALQEGMTAEAASRKFGPSIHTIKLWKRGWGLAKPRI